MKRPLPSPKPSTNAAWTWPNSAAKKSRRWLATRNHPFTAVLTKPSARPAAAEAEVEAEWYAVQSQKAEGSGQKRPSLLVDTYHPTLRGGTGITVEWGIVVYLFEHTPGIMLAGGLNPDNVAAAVKQLRPFAVDVASGVEASPGKKDHAKVRAFIANAKRKIDN